MTDRLSTNDPAGQQAVQPNQAQQPDVLPLPLGLHAEGEPETRPLPRVYVHPPEDGFGYLEDTDLEDDVPGAKGGNGIDGDDDPNPPASEGAALVIRAPSGPQPVQPGYTVAAVVVSNDDEGEEQFDSLAFLTAKKMQSSGMAIGLATFKALHPRRLPIPATHVVVNDETGKEVFRRPVLAAA